MLVRSMRRGLRRLGRHLPARAALSTQVRRTYACAKIAPALTRRPPPQPPQYDILPEDVIEWAKRKQTGVSLKALIDFGRNRDDDTLLTAAQFLHTELPTRACARAASAPRVSLSVHSLASAARLTPRDRGAGLAHRICDLNSLPYGLSTMPSIQNVKSWYLKSFQDLRAFPVYARARCRGPAALTPPPPLPARTARTPSCSSPR